MGGDLHFCAKSVMYIDGIFFSPLKFTSSVKSLYEVWKSGLLNLYRIISGGYFEYDGFRAIWQYGNVAILSFFLRR